MLGVTSAVWLATQTRNNDAMRPPVPSKNGILAVSASLIIYLVYASLILSALAGRMGLLTGWLLGALAYAAGLIASTLFDWPAGPAIVVALATMALIAGRMLRV